MATIKTVILKQWLVNYIVDEIHAMKSEESEEFNEWATNYKRESAEVVVDAEYIVDWGYEKREEVPVEEAERWGNSLIERILQTWYLE